jgi:hypothetical protein
MLNKLKLTTALVGAATLVSGASFAETKITGDIEQVYNTVSRDKADDQINGARAFSNETNIALSGSKDLDIGATLKYGFVLEDGTSDTEYTTLEFANGFSVSVAEDAGANLGSTAIPYVSDNFETVATSTGVTSYKEDGTGLDGSPHESAHIAFGFKADAGAFTYRYAPSGDSKTGDNSSTAGADDGGSETEVMFSGSLGIEGAKVIVGQYTIEQANDATAGDEQKFKRYGASYNFGNITVAAERTKADTGATTAGAEVETDKFGVAFAASDSLSLGIYTFDADKDGEANDEEGQMIQVGYNLGGLGLEFSFAQVENAGNSSGKDADIFQIRTRQKF